MGKRKKEAEREREREREKRVICTYLLGVFTEEEKDGEVICCVGMFCRQSFLAAFLLAAGTPQQKWGEL